MLSHAQMICVSFFIIGGYAINVHEIRVYPVGNPASFKALTIAG